MFNFLGFRKESKKSEKDSDGGFVIVGETAGERQRKQPSMNAGNLSTNVVIQPSQPPCPSPWQPVVEAPPRVVPQTPPAVEAVSALPDLLGDIPFTLAPHVLAVHAAFPPNAMLSRDVNYNLANFQYDFTLENSVLRGV